VLIRNGECDDGAIEWLQSQVR